MRNLTLRQHILIHQIVMWSGCGIALISALLKPPAVWLLYIGLGLVIAGLVWRVCFVKCPHCADKLLCSRVLPKYCLSCGKEIE